MPASRAEGLAWDEVREELRQLLLDLVRETVREVAEMMRGNSADELRHLASSCHMEARPSSDQTPPPVPRKSTRSNSGCVVARAPASLELQARASQEKVLLPVQRSSVERNSVSSSPGCVGLARASPVLQLSADGAESGAASGGSAAAAHWKERQSSMSPTGACLLPFPPQNLARQIPLPSGGPPPVLPRLFRGSPEASAAPRSPGQSSDELDLPLPMALCASPRLPSKGDSCAFRRGTFPDPSANIKSIWAAGSSSPKAPASPANLGPDNEMIARVKGLTPRALNRRAFESRSYRVVLKAWISSPCFDYLMGVLLVLNAMAVGWQVDHMAKTRDEAVPRYFRAFDTVFCMVFMAELVARILASGRKFFSMKEGWKWNWFDIMMVAFAMIDELALVLLTGTEVQEVIASLGVLRILRLGRIVRLVRMVRLIPELKSMVYLITASMSSFCWTVVLLLMLVYCFAVYFTELATELSRQNLADDAGIRVMLDHWGSLSRSTLALFMAISGGDDWRNFVDVFNTDNSHYLLHVLLFSIYIAFATMVMLNLVTGVFVDGAQKMFNAEQEDQLIRIAARIFVDAHKDSSESITFEEFALLVNTRCLDDWFAALGFSLGEADRLFQVIDEDDSGELSLSEFVRGCLRLKGNVKACDLALLKYNLKTQGMEIAKQLSRMEDAITALQMVSGAPGRKSSARVPVTSVGWYGTRQMEEEILV